MAAGENLISMGHSFTLSMPIRMPTNSWRGCEQFGQDRVIADHTLWTSLGSRSRGLTRLLSELKAMEQCSAVEPCRGIHRVWEQVKPGKLKLDLDYHQAHGQ